MRPYGKNGTTPAVKKSNANGVRKTLVKAKVSAVKTTRRLASKNGPLAGEVDNLLENSVVVTPAKKGPGRPRKTVVDEAAAGNGLKKVVSSANLKKQLKKLKGDSNGSNGTTETAAKETPRRSARKPTNGVASNGRHGTRSTPRSKLSPLDLSVDMAEEATEEDAVDGPSSKNTVQQAGKGFLRKTISKVWGGVPYSGLDQEQQQQQEPLEQEAEAKAKAKEAEANGKAASCVIS